LTESIVSIVEPVGVIDHDGVGRAVAECQVFGEDRPDAGHVAGDVGIRQQLPRLVLAGGVADLGRPSAHQHDRLVAGTLQGAQEHDGDEAADMQRIRRAVEADIGRDRALQGARIFRIRDLVHETALADGAQEVRFEGAHGRVVYHGALLGHNRRP
jgi:hypothetical protein